MRFYEDPGDMRKYLKITGQDRYDTFIILHAEGKKLEKISEKPSFSSQIE